MRRSIFTIVILSMLIIIPEFRKFDFLLNKIVFKSKIVSFLRVYDREVQFHNKIEQD